MKQQAVWLSTNPLLEPVDCKAKFDSMHLVSMSYSEGTIYIQKKWLEELLVEGRITLNTRRWSLIFPANDLRLFPCVEVQRCHGNGKLTWGVWLVWWANFAWHVSRKNALTFLGAESRTCASMLLYSAQCYSSLACPALQESSPCTSPSLIHAEVKWFTLGFFLRET